MAILTDEESGEELPVIIIQVEHADDKVLVGSARVDVEIDWTRFRQNITNKRAFSVSKGVRVSTRWRYGSFVGKSAQAFLAWREGKGTRGPRGGPALSTPTQKLKYRQF